MPPSKYERELRFIDAEVKRLKYQYQMLSETMPADPAEASDKAAKAMAMQEEIRSLEARRAEIEKSFLDAGMDLPDIGRSMNATVHNASGFEVHSPEEAEALAKAMVSEKPEPETKKVTETDISSEIEDITDELMALEIKMVRAEIDGDDETLQKLRMMHSSLRSRRDALVQFAKDMKAEKAGSASTERIEALEADNRALRAQLSDVRTDLQDVKDTLRLIVDALGLDRE